MLSSKLSILCVLKILEQYSDESHILNATDIQLLVKKTMTLKSKEKQFIEIFQHYANSVMIFLYLKKTKKDITFKKICLRKVN